MNIIIRENTNTPALIQLAAWIVSKNFKKTKTMNTAQHEIDAIRRRFANMHGEPINSPRRVRAHPFQTCCAFGLAAIAAALIVAAIYHLSR